MNAALSQPVDVVCAVIRHEDKYLLAQRPEGKRLAGCWEFPGGKVDEGESPEQALHRELMEELGCRVEVLRQGEPVLHAYDWGTIRLFPFLCQMSPESGQPHAHEHQALIWVFQKELLRPDIAPADVPVVAWLEKLA